MIMNSNTGSFAELGAQEYISKEDKKRTVIQQVDFNMQRIAVLEKELQELGAMLRPYRVDFPEKEHVKPDTGEVMSEVIGRLVEQSNYLDRLSFQVSELRRALQL